nr:MAG: RNA-dependent RNA-polymerase [Picobirnavirus sp.]
MPSKIRNNKFTNVISLNDYYIRKSQPSVRSYLNRVSEGSSFIVDTPFARGESTSKLLEKWIEHLESIRSRWPTLWDFEIDLSKKVGPLSVMKPWSERVSDVESYYEDILLSSTPINYQAQLKVVEEWAKFKGLRLRSKKRTIELMKKSTNSGVPYFTKRRNVIPETERSRLKFMHNQQLPYMETPDGVFDIAAMIGWRGQEGGPKPSDVKQRVVWMFPFLLNVEELRCYQPLIEVAQKFNIVPAWVGMDAVDREITLLFDSKGDNDLIVCTDFSRFDQHFNKDMSEAAQNILSKLMTSSMENREWLETIFPVKYFIPMITPTKVFNGRHGMGSGSGGTNADETLVHRALQYEAAIKHGATLNPHSMCLGDDGILTYPGITIEDVVDVYSQHGQEMNSDKQYASTHDCVYLRRWHHKEYRVAGVCAGVYSTCRALGRLRYMERFKDPSVWDERAVALRQLSIIEDVKYHPLKEEFVEFCMKRDKYRLGIDIPHFLDDIRSVALEKIENIPDFLGYTKQLQSNDPVAGIENWWIVRYLKSKS